MTLEAALSGLTRHVIGMDLHPVAVTLARVTYLLAIGRERLMHPDRGSIQVPVYLGDAVQWRREANDLFSGGNLVIETDDQKQLFESELRFPEELLEDPGRFNQIIESMMNLAGSRKPGSAAPKLTALYHRYAVSPNSQKTLAATFQTLCDLHDDGRDHIWSYYVRNLARPWWLSLPQNRVDALVGNPPWLAFRFMTEAMQEAFRTYSDERGLWHGAKVATHQDLSGLFLVRAVERYLRIGGRFAFVMPNAVVDRGQFKGLRTGRYKRPDAQNPVTIAFDPAWDLRRIRPHFFPRGSAVLLGTRADEPKALPTDVMVWTGRVLEQNASWDAVKRLLVQSPGKSLPASDDPTSPWSERFRQGATIVPRLLFFVTRQAADRWVGPRERPVCALFSEITTRNRGKNFQPLKALSRQSSSGPCCSVKALSRFVLQRRSRQCFRGTGRGLWTANRTASTPTRAWHPGGVGRRLSGKSIDPAID